MFGGLKLLSVYIQVYVFLNKIYAHKHEGVRRPLKQIHCLVPGDPGQ